MSNKPGLTVMSINVGRMLDPRTRVFLDGLGTKTPPPDVLCIQDIPARELSGLMERFPHVAFAPMTNHFVNGERMIVGIAMLSRYFMNEINYFTYWGNGLVKDLQGINEENQRYLGAESDRLVEETEDRILITAIVEKGEFNYHLATTHGMWTRGGEVNDVQRECMKELRTQLCMEGELRQSSIVFVGDFNAGRGTPMYKYLVEELVDHVPESVTTTLDPDHKVSKMGIGVVTDFVMQTQFMNHCDYEVSDFTMTPGVSDHQVISAHITYRS